MRKINLSKAAATIAAMGILGAGAALSTGTAFAASAQNPGCSATTPTCEVDGTVTVLASITLTMPVTSFTDGTLTAGTSSPAPGGPQFSANVVSSDVHGDSLVAVGGTDFVSTVSGNTDTFPASSLSIYQPGTNQSGSCTNSEWQASCGETQVALAEPGATPVTLGGDTGPNPGHGYSFATSVLPPLSAGATSYEIPVEFSALGL